jgi:hypothetical protein
LLKFVERNSFLSMKWNMEWWYRISLPRRGQDTTPLARERTRYTRLTSLFALVDLVASILLLPLSFINAVSPVASIIGTICLLFFVLAILLNRAGFNIIAASLILLSTIAQVTGTMFTNPLDLSLVPVFDVLVVPVILSGALLPPVASLVTGAVNSAIIVLISLFQTHSANYIQISKVGSYSVTLIALPVAIQCLVAIITFVIMTSLRSTIRRADRAEEIVTLQREISEHEHQHVREQQLLSDGLAAIAQVHSEIANGNLDVRVPLQAEHVLWQVAIPLNNLLNRIQRWKRNSDQLEATQATVDAMVTDLQKARLEHQALALPSSTGTLLDPLLLEMRHSIAAKDDPQSGSPSSTSRLAHQSRFGGDTRS